MKVRKPRLTDKNLSLRLKELYQICPFNLEDFYYENKDLVKKYIKKDTSKYQVDDWNRDELPLHWWYMGREGLLAASVKNSERPYTIKQKLEWIKCAVDVVYFTRKYIKIISIDDGVIPFNLYDYQEELLYTFQENRFVIGMQCRQSGKTQTTAAFITHFSIFNAAKTTAILANKASQAQEILERVQMSYEELPMFLQPGVKSYNKQSMILANKSKIFSAASSSSSIRGKSVSLLYIDEAAFINNDMTFYESTYPVIASGKNSRVIVTSTPNGTRGLFYKLWQESVSKTNEYVHKLVTWDMVPGRDEAWKRQTIANTSPEQFRQEHECVTGETIVNIRDENGEYCMAIEDLHIILENLKENDIKQTTIKERAKNRTGVVYKLIREDFKEYIGTAINFKNRLCQHRKSPRFSELSIVDYEILYEGNYYECLLLEEYFINLYDTYHNGLNNSKDGRGNHNAPNFTTLGYKYTDEQRQKIKDWHKSRDKSSYKRGYKFSEETKQRWSKKRKGKCHSQKLSKSDVEYILQKYKEFELTLEDCLKFDLIKKTQKERLLKDGWDGKEPLINKGGQQITKVHTFRKIYAPKYNVTEACITILVLEGRKCFKS